MGWWFGRKSAPADARPFVPAWLRNDAAEEGFARSYQAQFDEVYRRNPVGQRAVRLVAGMLGSLTIDGDPSTSSGQAAVALVKASGLLEGIAANLLLQGNAYPLIEAEDMPDIAAGSLSIAFGNFKAGYVIAERNATTILRDPYTHKPYVHFYATQTLDILVGGSVEDGPLATPPASPSIGDAYIVESAPSGDWVGQPGAVAAYTSGGWQFVAPVDGISLYVKSLGEWAVYRAGAWEIGLLRGSSVIIGGQQVVGSRAASIGSATGGTTIDTEARTAIDQILAAMRQHGLIES